MFKTSLKSVNEFIIWQYEELKIIEEVSVSNKAPLVNQATWWSPSYPVRHFLLTLLGVRWWAQFQLDEKNKDFST